MKNTRIQLAAIFALLVLATAPSVSGAAGTSARVKAGAKSPAAIARIADRRVEEADIQRAALVLAQDPLRTKSRAAWRKKLLELCVDRELLGLEAERQGISNEPFVRRKIERAQAEVFYDAIQRRFLIPAATPVASQIDTARAGGLFRRVKLSYILSTTDKKATYELVEAIKHGADFDSIAARYSVHPSASKGGEIGWKLVGQLNPGSWRAFADAKPGDLIGPYPNAQAHEFYLVEALADPTDAEIRSVMMMDPMREMRMRYEIGLLQKYHFRMIPDAVSPVMFAAATEKVDSILASLDAKGTRPKRDIHPALGAIATFDGDSIDYRDLASPDILVREPDGKSHIADAKELLLFCSAAVLPSLIARDAAGRGVDRDPAVARRVRLIREETATRTMVDRAVPPPDSAAAAAYFRAHAERYRRPAARRAFVTVFASADTAGAARASWDRPAARDSILAAEGFHRAENGTAYTMFPRSYGEVAFFDTDQDPLSVAVRGLVPGQISPLISTANGYAVAEGRGPEPARPYRFEEMRTQAWSDAREDAENAWVVKQLERLRAATPARTVPARLDAVRIGWANEPGGNRR